MTNEAEARVDEVGVLVDQITLLLQGKQRELQGGVLCDLVAKHFVRYPPDQREAMMEQWFLAMQGLLILNERTQALRN